jgi:hypothetical protein
MGASMFNGVSREQIARAKKINIEDYIRSHEPSNIRRVGNAYYLRDHNSLEISNGMWNWHSRGIGGKNVIDYLIKVRGYAFVDAVRHLAGEDCTFATIHSPPRTKPPPGLHGRTGQRADQPALHGRTGQRADQPDLHRRTELEVSDQPKLHKQATNEVSGQPERKPFNLPPRNANNDRVITYLESRGIDSDIISNCINRRALYESTVWHNCVFVGRDENGKARFASLRGTAGNLKRDADGSDKRFGFCLPPVNPHSETVLVFESPIDLLSYDTLRKGGYTKQQDGWRLSLDGTSMLALTHLIEQQKFKQPISHCIVCTDNDTAGHTAFSEIAEKLTIMVSRLIPAGKDWNETLQKIKNEVKPMVDERKEILFIDSHYNELFRVKDGDSIKATIAYDNEVKTLKCRYIDESHVRIIGSYSEIYHICELAERSERVGNKYEAIPDQEPKLDVIAAKYGEPLQYISIPMTEAAIEGLVGGKYEIEPLYVNGQGVNGRHGPYIHDAILHGKDGMVVCAYEDSKLTSLHPYWAQKYKHDLSPAQRAETEAETLLGEVAAAKSAVTKSAVANRVIAERAVQDKTTAAR